MDGSYPGRGAGWVAGYGEEHSRQGQTFQTGKLPLQRPPCEECCSIGELKEGQPGCREGGRDLRLERQAGACVCSHVLVSRCIPVIKMTRFCYLLLD